MTPEYKVELCVASRGYDRKTCWVHPRAGIIPFSAGGKPTGVLTMQKLDLHGSDIFNALHSLSSTDRGKTWTTPVIQTGFARQAVEGGGSRCVCDFWPKWHAKSGALLGTGHTAYYTPENEILEERPRQTAYATYDAATGRWGEWRELVMPQGPKFHNAGAGCTQRVDLPNGDILLPIYARVGAHYVCAATVVRCAFDGRELRYLEHGDEMSIPQPRGFCEPSLACWGGRYFLTLRNDEAGYVTAGDDGLHFPPPIRWTFDDGEDLGNYNTQQHWVAHSEGLFLVYTRRGLNNDHVFRHRAPLLMARIDPDRLCVIRNTERIIVPQRGARLGNFGVTEVDQNETWVTVAEWMQTNGPNPYDSTVCEKYGSDNSVFVARILWDRPNRLVTRE